MYPAVGVVPIFIMLFAGAFKRADHNPPAEILGVLSYFQNPVSHLLEVNNWSQRTAFGRTVFDIDASKNTNQVYTF